MLQVSYDPILVTASVVVAAMAAFTCLRLTSGLSQLGPAARKPRIAQAAVALGGGIWSMHFVGMLAVQVPVALTYDALPTLGSALIAILVTGLGLMILHFGARTRTRIVAAGVLTGVGIVCMHYLGMWAVSGDCIIGYDATGVALASAIGIGSSILALDLAYRRRTLAATLGGAVVLGLAISAMHYAAMLFTSFAATDASAALVAEPNLSSGALAMVVATAAFVICGLFLLTAVPTSEAKAAPVHTAPAPPAPADPPQPAPSEAEPDPRNTATVLSRVASEPRPLPGNRIPYERDNAIRFLAAEQIAAVRADGHYTRILHGGAEFFCPWPISRLEKALQSPSFLRTHRSYIVNLDHVVGFRRVSDKGFCLVDDESQIPVSRSQMPKVQRALGFS
ncbi:MAG: MHYT domain-containing protein [Alphaproteobacteria bacterium]